MSATEASVRFPDRFEEPKLIAYGGMGSIYCAKDTALGRLVAIKLLDDRYAADATVLKRFRREAFAAARLSSDPNTITIFDVGECDGRPFIVMQYLPGGSLASVLKSEGAQPPSRTLDWLRQAGGALDHAHQHNVVHRDVKPANLLLTEDRRLLVADFGVASAAGLDSFTQTGTIIGTAGYLSPEQAEGLTATPASDRYSLGVVGFELLDGSRPFERPTPTVEASAHVHDPVPSLSARRIDIPSEIDAVFEQALAKDPADRYGSCAEFVAALHQAFTQGAEPTRIIFEPSKATDPPRGNVPERFKNAVPSTRRGPLRKLLLLVGSLILVAAGVFAALLASTDREPSKAARPDRITVTARGRTVVRTVTQSTRAATVARTSVAAVDAPSKSNATATGLRGYARMQAGDYAGALPFLEEAAQGLQGAGSLDEAYNDYNLALSLERTSGCSPRVLQLLDESEAIQGHRAPIDRLRRACRNPP